MCAGSALDSYASEQIVCSNAEGTARSEFGYEIDGA